MKRASLALLVALALAGCKGKPKAGATAAPVDPRAKATKLLVDAYATKGYPAWHAEHPEVGCPGGLGEVQPFVGQPPTDAWGQPLLMWCGSNAPPGTDGFAVVSVGPDGKSETPDDVHSWDR